MSAHVVFRINVEHSLFVMLYGTILLDYLAISCRYLVLWRRTVQDQEKNHRTSRVMSWSCTLVCILGIGALCLGLAVPQCQSLLLLVSKSGPSRKQSTNHGCRDFALSFRPLVSWLALSLTGRFAARRVECQRTRSISDASARSHLWLQAT